MDKATLKTIKKIISTLENNPNKLITCNLGSGCHARPYGENNQFHKIVIPGDNYDMAKSQLHYLFYDLGVDCGLSDDELKTLECLR